MSGLIWVQTVRKGYQQMTPVNKELQEGVVLGKMNCKSFIFCQILAVVDRISIYFSGKHLLFLTELYNSYQVIYTAQNTRRNCLGHQIGISAVFTHLRYLPYPVPTVTIQNGWNNRISDGCVYAQIRRGLGMHLVTYSNHDTVLFLLIVPIKGRFV